MVAIESVISSCMTCKRILDVAARVHSRLSSNIDMHQAVYCNVASQ
jgi:hypothetical protein